MRFINLAGHKDSTNIIISELKRCEIEVVTLTKPLGEPKSYVKGKLKGFEFERAWVYYIVKGYVPEYVNDVMYRDYVGKSDIRSGGDCGCRNIWVQYYKDGKEVAYFTNKELELVKENFPEELDKFIQVPSKEDAKKIGKGYVNMYHIDSELGLYKFVQYMKTFNVTGELS